MAVGAASLGTLAYSSLRSNEAFLLWNQAVVIPVLSVTGLWMWLGPRIRAYRNRKTASASTG